MKNDSKNEPSNNTFDNWQLPDTNIDDQGVHITSGTITTKDIIDFERVVKSAKSFKTSPFSNNIPEVLELLREYIDELKKQQKEKYRLFFTGFLQVFFVAINTYFITQKFYIGVLIVSFLISFIWSFNMRKVAFGNMKDRIIYSLGASIGGLVGLLSATFLT